MRTCLVIAALGLAACDGRHHHYKSETMTTFVDGRPTTTLIVRAWTAWGDHGSVETEPNEELDLYAGPSPGALRRLVEEPPGRYTAILDGEAPAYRYRIVGDDHVHAAATMYTAAVTTSAAERTAVVTWDPPLVDEPFGQSITIGLTSPSDYPTFIDCPPLGVTRTAELPDRLEIAPCALSESGTYRVEVRREHDRLPEGETDGYAYSWADVEIVRELTFDMP